jgi:hypothetical protein
MVGKDSVARTARVSDAHLSSTESDVDLPTTMETVVYRAATLKPDASPSMARRERVFVQDHDE